MLVTELVDLDCRPECDHAEQRVRCRRAEELQRLLERVLERGELRLDHARVNHPKKYGRRRGRARERVLDRRVLWYELRRQVLLVDVVVVRREVVALEAKRTDPDLRLVVDSAERVEDRWARSLADDRLVR